MKKIIIPFLILLLAISCKKESDDIELPGWLKERIAQDETIIRENPSLMPNYGAWYRYRYEGDYYYEYDNPMSSLARHPISALGEGIDVPPYDEYQQHKCCEKLVWKGDRYNRLTGL